MISLFKNWFAGQKELALVAGMVGILIILFTPIPPGLLDFLLILNFSFALLILLLTFYTDKPLSFSTFPSLLLVATLFRLALNISATRLILDGADAGKVIESIGSYVVGGNYVIGLVVFFILIVVQYVVVTNGAQRVAEVAARFTLDSMPGKQMSIDADMNMGIIDENEARERRAQVEKEANFYGAMDGATKFVKGDAVAGIIIILIDIIGGLSIGIAQLGMSWGDALHSYTLLTVGDGIVTQIPSLIIATSTGIIITRAATDSRLGEEVARQIMGHPKTLVIVCVALLGILLLPGLPSLPVFIALALFGAGAWFALRSAAEAEESEPHDAPASEADDEEEDLYDLISVQPVEIRIGKELSEFLSARGENLSDRLKAFRKQFALELGLVLPKVRVRTDDDLAPQAYSIHFHDANVGKGELRADRFLAIASGSQKAELEGESTREPTYGLPAKWIGSDQRQYARGAGYTLVEPVTVLMTHFSELVRRHAGELLSRAETEQLVRRVGEEYQTLVDELVPNVISYSDIQNVLRCLLREKVSIRNIETILEVLAESAPQSKDPEFLAERVRERLGGAICQSVADGDGNVHVLTLAPELEHRFLSAARQEKDQMFSDPMQMDGFIKSLANQSEAMMAKSLMPVLLCPGPVRKKLRDLVHRALPHVSILGLNEIPTNANVRSFGIVALDKAA